MYEVDADPDRIDEEMTRSQADSIAKQGFLYKGPDTASDRMFAHIGSKSFKRRYCYLRQEVDGTTFKKFCNIHGIFNYIFLCSFPLLGTYILELHKDEKQCEAKATIVMDFCTEVVLVCEQMNQNIYSLGHSTILFKIPESKTWPILL